MGIDLYDSALFAGGHPVEAYRALRDQPGLHWNPEPKGPGFWAVTRYADVHAVNRDHEHFSSEPTIMIDDPEPALAAAGPDAKMMLMMDPPQHTGFRKLIRAEFTREASDGRGPRISALARQIVDEIIERGECDFVADVAGEMPSYVIAELMGLPLQDGRELYKLTEIIHSSPETLPEGAQGEAVGKMFGYAAEVYAAKLAAPKDDLATRLIQAEVEGRRLTQGEFLLFFMLLVDAGGDTTRNLLASGLWALHNARDQLRWLVADLPGRIASAREELLRFTTPVIYMRRTAKRDVTVGGTEIRAGQKAVMYFCAANRDPARFADPDRLDLSRNARDHLAFGTGPHVCLGQHLARLEIDAMLTEVLGRLEDLEVVGEPEWLASTFISGPRAMKVRYRPGRRLG